MPAPDDHWLREVRLAWATQLPGPDPAARLETAGRGLLPRTPGAGQVLTFPLAGPFGRLLDAAARFLHDGGRESAQEVAVAARTVRSLTVAANLRHYRESDPGPDARAEKRLRHQVTSRGNGILALQVSELLTVSGRRLPRTVLPRPVPEDPDAWTVVWSDITAPGLILGAAARAHHGDTLDLQMLASALATAVRTLTPAIPEPL
ncbi:hypothetical protein [Streptacidiphilus sp. EB129]|uniref:hypothetical protein n=1 Tax=Streptacidiphilus sp. EB129 TaxID=3156262 RepID=UPI003514E29D